MSSHKEPLNNIYHVGLSDVKIAILAVCSWTSNYTYTHIHVHTHAGVLAQSDTSPALTPPSYLLSTGCGSLSHAILSHNPPSFIVCLVNKGEVQWLPVTPHSLPFASQVPPRSRPFPFIFLTSFLLREVVRAQSGVLTSCQPSRWILSSLRKQLLESN